MNIMVATGSNGYQLRDTEVINVMTIASCSNLPTEYPLAVDHAVALKHDSKMVICGGYSSGTSDCYSYSNDNWNLEAFKLEPYRYGAISVEIRPDEWLIMGGSDGLYLYGDSKLFKNGIFIQGPDLPGRIYGGSAAMVNESHLFVAVGHDGFAYSRTNYLFNIDTRQWKQIADRKLSPYQYHTSGTFYNSQDDEIQVANIGRYGIEAYSPGDNRWHELSFPSPYSHLYGSVAIQRGYDSFILIGGDTNYGHNGDIFLMDDNGLSILKENVLQVPRRYHVAMPISKEDFTCA